MGKYRYERIDPVEGARTNVINFDSSPKYSLTKQYGFSPVGFELRETNRTEKQVDYDVYAAYRTGGTDEEPEYGPLNLRGKLTEKTEAALLERFG